MSLWTPDGEYSTTADDSTTGDSASGPTATGQMPPSFDELSPEDQVRAQEMAKEMAETQQRILEMPSADIVANHVMGFYELAALHLSQEPPSLAEATIAIDAMAAVLDGLRGRLGEAEPTLRDARAQLQMAFVQLKANVEGADSTVVDNTEADHTEVDEAE